MIITTTDSVDGYKVKQYLGIVSVTSHNMTEDLEVDNIMMDHLSGSARGADAIIGVRLMQTETNIIETGFGHKPKHYVSAYGTAVKLEKEQMTNDLAEKPKKVQKRKQ